MSHVSTREAQQLHQKLQHVIETVVIETCLVDIHVGDASGARKRERMLLVNDVCPRSIHFPGGLD